MMFNCAELVTQQLRKFRATFASVVVASSCAKGRCLTENCLGSFVADGVCITAGGKRRHIATSSLPPFVAFCRSGFAVDFSSSQSLGDGVLKKLPADKGKTNARYSL